jgi:archaellum component FlaC
MELKEVWNGVTGTQRPDGSVDRAPDQYDWEELVRQLQATQHFILTLTGQHTVADTAAQLEDASKKVEALLARVNALAMPEDLRASVNELDKVQREQAEEMHAVSKTCREVNHALGTLKANVDMRLRKMEQTLENMKQALNAQHAKHVEEVNAQVVALRNEVENALQCFEWAV